MYETVSTIYYNGQFWKALIERIGEDGKRTLAEYTFGSEPAAGDLYDFYLNKSERLQFVRSDRKVKIRKHRKDNEQRLMKSHDEFKESQRKMLEARKAVQKQSCRIEAVEKYREKIAKKKMKKRGH